MKYKAILFDVDDTLLDSFSARLATIQHIFTSAGIAHHGAERFLRDLQGAPLESALAQLAVDHDSEIDLFLEYRRTYWFRENGLLKLYPGVREALGALHGLRLKLGIVTTKAVNIEFEDNVIGAAKELRELGIVDFFSAMVGFEDVSLPKPHPEGINLAIGRLKVIPSETLMVGDSVSDIAAAKAAGCLGCYATWGLPVDERDNLLDTISPDFILNSPDELLKLVR